MDNESKFLYAREVTEASVINSEGRNRYYFAIYHGLSQVKIFSYDDSDIFDPILIHTFHPKEVTFAHCSPLGSFLVGAKWNGVVIMHTEPDFKETDIGVDGEVHKVVVSRSENFLIVTHVRRENENYFKLEIRDMKTTEIRKTLNPTPKNAGLTTMIILLCYVKLEYRSMKPQHFLRSATCNLKRWITFAGLLQHQSWLYMEVLLSSVLKSLSIN